MIDTLISIVIAAIFVVILWLTKSILLALLGTLFLFSLAFLFISHTDSLFFLARQKSFAYLSKENRYIGICIALVSFYLLSPQIGVNPSLIVSFFIVNYFLNFSERSSFVVALIFLSFCPFFLYVRQESLAEKSAVLAYYFLSIGTGWLVLLAVKPQLASLRMPSIHEALSVFSLPKQQVRYAYTKAIIPPQLPNPVHMISDVQTKSVQNLKQTQSLLLNSLQMSKKIMRASVLSSIKIITLPVVFASSVSRKLTQVLLTIMVTLIKIPMSILELGINILRKMSTIPSAAFGFIRNSVVSLMKQITFVVSYPFTLSKALQVAAVSKLQKLGKELTKKRTTTISISTPPITAPALPVIPHTTVSAWPLQLMRGSYTAYKSLNSTIEQLNYFQSLVPVKIVEREKVAPYENVIYYKPEKKDEAAYIAAFLAIPFKLKENENMGDDLSIILW